MCVCVCVCVVLGDMMGLFSTLVMDDDACLTGLVLDAHIVIFFFNVGGHLRIGTTCGSSPQGRIIVLQGTNG